MTESTTSSPHDAVFKTFMFTPETARDFLEIHLPYHGQASTQTLCLILMQFY